MQSAANEVQKFAQSSNKHVNSLQKSMEHLAAGRHFSKLMGEVGGALGGNGQLIQSAVRNFQHFGPVIGLVATAVEAGAEAWKSYDEAIKRNEESTQRFFELNKELGKYTGDMFNAGKFEEEFNKRAEAYDKAADELKQKEVGWGTALWDSIKGTNVGGEHEKQIRDAMNKAAEIRQMGRADRKDVDNPLKDFENQMFDIKKKGKGATENDHRKIMAEEYQAEMELVDQLTQKLDTLKEGGKEYEEIWKEIKTHTLAAVNLKDEYKSSIKKGMGGAAHLGTATSFNAAVIQQLQHSGGLDTGKQQLAVAQKQLAALVEIKKMSGKQVAVAGS